MNRRFVLTGGIGSGKSLAGVRFAALGAEVVSADEVGHAVIGSDGPAAGEVAERWPQVVAGDGVDRAALATIVFNDPAELAALEAMTHPHIARRIMREVDASTAEVVIVETPVARVVGEDWPRIVVDAPEAVRVDRLRARGMSEPDIRARMEAQPTRSEWLVSADYVIDNSGNPEELTRECAAVWRAITG